MRRALELAAKGLGHTRPNPAVGCVILDKEGRVVGEGFHPRAGEPHAEVRRPQGHLELCGVAILADGGSRLLRVPSNTCLHNRRRLRVPLVVLHEADTVSQQHAGKHHRRECRS